MAAALVFFASGAVLVLEILGVRLLAPYVGLSLQTTTAIIGAVLAGIAAGAAIGGRLADRGEPLGLVSRLFLAGGVLALLTVPLIRLLGDGLRGTGDAGALALAFVTLMPAAAVLSGITPAVAKLELSDLGRSATVFGRLSGWATAGALAGTFVTGFVLVPTLPVTAAVVATGTLLVVCGLGVGVAGRTVSPVTLAVALGVAVAAGAASVATGSPCQTETDYHCANVTTDPDRPSGRVLELDDLRHSYVDLEDPRRLAFEYTRWMGDAIDALPPRGAPVDGVYVGGGGFTLPRYVAATRPGSRATVLELDGDLVDVARRRLGLRTGPDLRVRVGDARLTLRDLPTASADVVVADAFGGRAVPWHLATAEWFRDVRRVLRPGGLLAMNVIDRRGLRLARAEAATVLDTFADVRLVEDPGGAVGNRVLLASERPLPRAVASRAFGATTIGRRAVERFAAGAPVLTDDSAPADQLLETP